MKYMSSQNELSVANIYFFPYLLSFFFFCQKSFLCAVEKHVKERRKKNVSAVF